MDWLVASVEYSKRPVAIVRPSQAFTNQQGLTRVFVSSPTGGTFEFSVLSQGSEEEAVFNPITFEGDKAPE
ncbi:hypothetical protein PYV50_16955 [Pseudomonas sp. H22_DOA]|nr:hypothetical protein PYV50_16955 [Pseudomonas sp. H22_DOA]